MDESMKNSPVLETLAYLGNGVFTLDGDTAHLDVNALEAWFAVRGHRVEILPNMILFRSRHATYAPPHTAFVRELVRWDPVRHHLWTDPEPLPEK